jgi:methyltransferase family protein
VPIRSNIRVICGSLLDRAAHHLLFLVQSKPDLSDRWGYHIRPIHYYEPLPDFRAITTEQITRRREAPAIDFHWNDQLALLNELAAYRVELNALDFDFDNAFFNGFDAAIYYSLIRHLKPKRIIEIGGGHSTQIASKALSANGNGQLTCIEPYAFARLEANDILFIDSSHTVKFGSDVCFEFLEILPVLKPGVWVHVHDIFLPHDYPAEWLLKRRLALNEQYLLEAFLSFNTAFAPQLANYWLCLDYPENAACVWTTRGASSFWTKRVA